MVRRMLSRSEPRALQVPKEAMAYAEVKGREAIRSTIRVRCTVSASDTGRNGVEPYMSTAHSSLLIHIIYIMIKYNNNAF